MSWKGFQKGLVRTPQNIRQKMNKGGGNTDLVILDAEDRFNAIEVETRKLQTESRRYHSAINGMLAHQIRYSEILETVYQPISGRLSDPNQAQQEDGHEAGIAACQQYRQQVNELQELIRPELEMIESRIIRPAEDMLTITASVKKMFIKCEHKQLDLDRHSQTLRKAQDKNDHTVKHEEKVYKVENEYEMALEEYNYYNELLKTELPKLFELQGNFIRPLFQSFYYMQISIFYTLHEHMEAMKIPYFDIQGDLLETFQSKRGDVLARAENIGILQFRSKPNLGGKRSLGSRLSRKSSTASSAFSGRARSGGTEGDSDSSDPWGSSDDDEPAHSKPPVASSSLNRSPSGAKPASASTAPPAKPPRPGHAPTPAPPLPVCVALYDFDAQASGDLTLRAGDRIEITEKTEAQEGWWKGILNGQEGIFPANYVEMQ